MPAVLRCYIVFAGTTDTFLSAQTVVCNDGTNRQNTLESQRNMFFRVFLFLFWLGSERLKTRVHVRMILPTFSRVFVFFKKTCFPCERSASLITRAASRRRF